MKKIITLVLVAVAALSLDSYAGVGNRRIKKDLKVSLMPTNMILYEKNGTVDLMYKVVVPAGYVHPKHQYVFTPVFTDYNNVMPLPSIVINGKKYAKILERDAHNPKMKEMLKSQPDMSNAIVLPASKNPRIIEYIYVAPYQKWMQNADLVLVQRFNSKKNTVLIAEDVYSNGVTVSTPPAAPATIKSTNTTEIINKMEGKVNINFPVNSSKIDMTFDNNIRELYNLKTLIKSVMDNKEVMIDSVLIIASSSPEGAYEYNDKLSMARANSVKAYLEKEFGLTEQTVGKFKTRNIAENWTGLRNLVEGSSMNNVPQILKAISVDNLAQREKAMMALPQYPAIKKYILPQLRYVKYEIYYHNMNKTVVVKTVAAPQPPQQVQQPQQRQQMQQMQPMMQEVKMHQKHGGRLYREDHYRKTGSMRVEAKVKENSHKMKTKVKEHPDGRMIQEERYQKRR